MCLRGSRFLSVAYICNIVSTSFLEIYSYEGKLTRFTTSRYPFLGQVPLTINQDLTSRGKKLDYLLKLGQNIKD